MTAATKMTDSATVDRLAALERRRSRTASGRRARPAEASRLLVAGAGTAAVLTMMTAMAQSDQAVAPPEVVVLESPIVSTPQTVDAITPADRTVTEAPVGRSRVVQTITVARPVRAQVSNGRTSASR